MEINLSTTQRSPDGLSSVFAENLGADLTQVSSGPLLLTGPTSAEFNYHIALEQPFVFDPSRGNLLLEVKNFQTLLPMLPEPGFTAVGALGDTTSLAVAFDVNSSTAFLGTGGLWRTQFTATAVPAPSSILMLLSAPALVAILRIRTRARRAASGSVKGKGFSNVFAS